MFVIKCWYHMCAIIMKIFYRIIYGSKLNIGKGTTWRKSLSIIISDEGKIKIGKNCFFNNYCSINSMQLVSIGDNTLFGENVKIYDHNHRFRDKDKTIKEQGFSVDSIYIGDNCWIGSDVVILKGVHIGNNCIIGAGVVVTESIPDNTIVRFNRELIKEKIEY